MSEDQTRSAAPDYDTIVGVICRELEKVNTAGVVLTEDTDMTSELNLDSVAVMDLMFELEERFDVSVPLNQLGEVRTVGHLAVVVRDIAAAKEQGSP